MREMSKATKSTSITSSRRARKARPQKARIFSVEEGSGKVVLDGDVVGHSPGELVTGIADPLARAIKSLNAGPGGGIDVIVISDHGEKKGYVIEGKSPLSKGKGRIHKGGSGKTSIRITRKGHVYSPRGGGKSSLLSGLERVPRIYGPSTEELAERMLPEVPVPSPAQATLAQRESQARWGMLEEFGAFTSEELADQRSQAKNRHALANRWRSEGKVFAVELRGRRLYPGFQFDPETFAPEPVVAEVLAALPREEMSEWEVALWWVASDPWLEGRRPVDVMREDPEAVSAAAAGLAEPSPL